MSRLVKAVPPGDGGGRFASAEDRDGYWTRVAKYVPAEIVAGYTALVGLNDAIGAHWWVWATFIVCLILTPVYFSRMAMPGQPKLLHAGLSTAAFIVWAYATAAEKGPFGPIGLNIYHGPAASGALVLFSLISGAFQPKEGDN